MDTGSYEYWLKTGREMGSPFNDEPITEDSVFLWEEMTSPTAPRFFQVGIWGIFPNARTLGGYILHKFFFASFENWLVREEWDDDYDEIIPVRELLRRAKDSGKCRYVEDIPLMEKLIILSEETLKDQEGKEIFDSFKKIVSLFNDKWESTGTWCFSIELFDDAKEVGLEIESEYSNEEFRDQHDFSRAEWRLIYSDISDKKNQEKFKEILRNMSEG